MNGTLLPDDVASDMDMGEEVSDEPVADERTDEFEELLDLKLECAMSMSHVSCKCLEF